MAEVKPVTRWNMWVLFVNGQPRHESMSPYHCDAQQLASRWREYNDVAVKRVEIRVVPKRRAKKGTRK